MANIRVLEVTTFYTMFNLEPVGRFHVQLCGTTPCMLRGSEDLKKVLRRVIGDEHHVTTDGTFSWIEVECLGACVNAPMAQINADYYEDLTPETLTRILNDMAAGKKPKPGPQVEREFSAPVGGPLTLTDPSLYPEGSRASPARAALHDEDAKKPGEAANLHEAAVPKPPATDATDPRRH
jgi:NADH-quinone oxidoreductase subunit E